MYTCSITGCNRKRESRGWCGLHYQRWYNHGDPEVTLSHKTHSLEEALEHYARWEGDCWLWEGAKSVGGYAVYRGENQRHNSQYLHRIMWERENGPIPDGMEIDHMCFVVNCINVQHLRPLTRQQQAENLSGKRKNNTSGVRGVSWSSREGKYLAHVHHKGKKYFCGAFDNPDDAIPALLAKRSELYTPNPLQESRQ